MNKLLHLLFVDFCVLFYNVLEVAHGGQPGLDVFDLPPSCERDERPAHQAEKCDGHHEDDPEPDEDEDDLVEEVHREGALYGVAVNVSKLAHLDVAEGDARKPVRGGPVLAAEHALHHVETVLVVLINPEEPVQEEQLTQGVGHVQQLDEQVAEDEVPPVETPTQGGTAPRLKTRGHGVHEKPAHVPRHVGQDLLPLLRHVGSLALDGGVCDRAHGHAWLLVQHHPDGARQVEEDCLGGQDQRYPLVVPDHLMGLIFPRDVLLLVRQVVRVRRPAYLQHMGNTTSELVFN